MVVASGESLNLLAERHLTTVTTLRGLNPTLTGRPSDQLPLGSWLFIPKRRAAANADTSTSTGEKSARQGLIRHAVANKKGRVNILSFLKYLIKTNTYI